MEVHRLNVSWKLSKPSSETRLEFDSSVLSLFFDSTSQSLFVGLNNGSVQQFSRHFQLMRSTECHDKGVKALAVIRGEIVVTGSYDRLVKAWQPQPRGWVLLETFHLHADAVWDIQAWTSPNGSYRVATCGMDGKIHILGGRRGCTEIRLEFAIQGIFT